MGFWNVALPIATGGASLLATSLKNKSRAKAPEFAPYSGYRPPHVNYLRPVEDQITQILMERSKDIGTGFNPERLSKLKENYDIDQSQRDERNIADLNNELSATGQSRNLAARDYLLNRYKRDQERERNKYFNSYDIEDLATKNQEKREATGQLADLNRFNFGQENKVADFDLSVYGAENNQRNQTFQNQMAQDQTYQDPFGEAFNTGLSVLGATQGADYNRAVIDALKSRGNQGQDYSAPFVKNPTDYSYGVPSIYNNKRLKTTGF